MKTIAYCAIGLSIATSVVIGEDRPDPKDVTFAVEGVVKISYPSKFKQLDGAGKQAVLDYAKRLVAKSDVAPEVAFDQVAVLHTAFLQDGDDYAHVNLTMMPPEITQGEFADSDQEFIDYLTKAMFERIQAGLGKSGNEVVGNASGAKESLGNGIKVFTLKYTYRKRDGSLRIDTKRYVYTKRHTLVIGITTSDDYAKENADALKGIVDSIVAAGD